MLLPSDQAALRGSRFLPHGSNAVAAGLAVRTATLDTATYEIVQPGGTSVPLTYIFGTNSVQAGNQVRFKVYGHVSDTGASNITVRLKVTQATALVPVFIIPNTRALDVAFQIEGVVTFSQPGAPGRGVVTLSKSGQSYSGGAQDSLIAGSVLTYLSTDASYNTATRRGGAIIADPAAGPSTLLSVMATNNDANAVYLFGGQPISVSVELTSITATITILGGYLEAM